MLNTKTNLLTADEARTLVEKGTRLFGKIPTNQANQQAKKHGLYGGRVKTK